MIWNKKINIEEKDDQLSEEWWDGFNHQLTKQISQDLFSEQSSDLAGTQQDQGEPIDYPKLHVEGVLCLALASEETLSQEEPTSAHNSKESEESIDGNRKNICSYVLKKAVQVFFKGSSRKLLEKQCQKQGITYSQVMDHFRSTLPKVLGIAALTEVLTAETESQFRAKEVFRKFLRWFLRRRYMLHLLPTGKMWDKLSYINVKNKQLLYFQDELANTLLSMSSIKD